MSRITIIVQPTLECNLACRYCYNLQKRKTHNIMGLEVLSQIYSLVKNDFFYKEINFLWHGGEPLLSGIEFFKKVALISKKLRKRGVNIRNSIQTNGTLLTDEYISFFKKNNFTIGISLDGPEIVHNINRKYKNGTGSFHDIYLNIKKIRKLDNLFQGVLIVLNRTSIENIKDVYNFFKNERINFNINPLFVDGNAKRFIKDLVITQDEYSDAFIYFFDKWFHCDFNLINHQFEDLLASVLFSKPSSCNFFKTCVGHFICIAPEGTIYPCNRFSGKHDFSIGNVTDFATISDIFSTKKMKRLKAISMRRATNYCNGCVHINYCNAGCMHNAYLYGDINTNDFFCRSYKKIFDHINKLVLNELSNDGLINIRPSS